MMIWGILGVEKPIDMGNMGNNTNYMTDIEVFKVQHSIWYDMGNYGLNFTSKMGAEI
jgi:hypothetical protein